MEREAGSVRDRASGDTLRSGTSPDHTRLRVEDQRVTLRAEQPGRSFAWLVSAPLAERLAGGLRERGWTVTITPQADPPEAPDTREGDHLPSAERTDGDRPNWGLSGNAS